MTTSTPAPRAITLSGNGAIPAGVTVGSFQSVLYVHDGSDFITLGQVGNIVKLKVATDYPAGKLTKTMDTRWTHDTTAVATEMARRINSCPVGPSVRFVQIRPLRSIPYSGRVVQVGIDSGFRSVG